jgi:RNA polymerase sigma factor (TIGR02999 family)
VTVLIANPEADFHLLFSVHGGTLPRMSEVTRLIDAAAAGHPAAAAQLLPLVYAELRKLADARLAAERPGHTLQATALVHEAFLRLVGPDPTQPWNGRGHFFAAAAEAMRRILVESARRKRRVKHGGVLRRVELEDHGAVPDGRSDEILAIDKALDGLAREDAAKADLVKLRYFAGLTLTDAAACQGISLATAKRRWAIARAWLFDAISTDS